MAKCELDVVGAVAHCDPHFRVEQTDGMALVAIDVPVGHAVLLDVEVCDPRGWVLNVGDSATNNGGGGDYGTTSNDAELHVRDTTLEVFGSDYAIGDPARRSTIHDFLQPDRCQLATALIEDAALYIAGANGDHDFFGDALLRLDPRRDDEGHPDNRWFVGLNRVIGSTARHGTGVETATIRIVPALSQTR